MNTQIFYTTEVMNYSIVKQKLDTIFQSLKSTNVTKTDFYRSIEKQLNKVLPKEMSWTDLMNLLDNIAIDIRNHFK